MPPVPYSSLRKFVFSFAAIPVSASGIEAENAAFCIRYVKDNYWIESQEDVEAIARLLETVILQREIASDTDEFPHSAPAVQEGSNFYLDVYDLDNIQYSMPICVGYYSFLIASPTDSRFLSPPIVNRVRYRILNAESILDELMLILSIG